MDSLTICLIIFGLTIVSFAVNYFSMATTALLSVLLLTITGCIDANTALSGFANTNTITLVSMFIVSTGLNRTQMINKVSGTVQRISGGSFRKILFGYVLVAFFLTQFIRSAMAVFCIVYPLAMSICKSSDIKPSKMMFSLGVVTIATNCILPIGAGATIFTEFNGYLQSYDYTTFQYGMLDPCWARLPVAIVVIAYMVFLAPRFAPDKNMLASTAAAEVQAKEQPQLGPVREFLGYFIFVLVILGLLFQSYVGLDVWQITMLGALLMVATGVLTPAEAVKSMNLNIALLYVGALGIGSALVNTGAGEVIGNTMAGLLGTGANGYLIGFVFFIVPFLLTQVMMNNAVWNIFVPICILTCKTLGCNPLGPLMLVISGSTTAFMTPMATPAVAMVMNGGGYDIKTLLKMSILPAIMICIVSVFWIMTYFPAY